MRIFSFRAWDKSAKRMINPRKVKGSIMPVVRTKKGFRLKTKFVLMQNTGLKDIKGKDIYEGDIVKTYPKCDKLNNKRIGIVSWSDKNAAFHIGGDLDYSYFIYPWQKMLVIGNIFENAPLRKTK